MSITFSLLKMIAGKLFKVLSDDPLEMFGEKLQGFRNSTEDTEAGLSLKTEIEVREIKDGTLIGDFYRDNIVYLGLKEGKKPAVSTSKISFFIRSLVGQTFLLILAKKRIANEIANTLSKILFMKPGTIVEARIDPEAFLEYYRRSLEETRVAFFDQVDIPSVNVLALYGEGLSDTDLFKEYQTHGLLWYIVVKVRSANQIIGLTRNSVITIFSQGTQEDIVKYAFNEVIPLFKPASPPPPADILR